MDCSFLLLRGLWWLLWNGKNQGARQMGGKVVPRQFLLVTVLLGPDLVNEFAKM